MLVTHNRNNRKRVCKGLAASEEKLPSYSKDLSRQEYNLYGGDHAFV
ncbi:hypothetical protein [Halobacillus naozhouensis]|uniref:Uncharacterized protein n=1 Tax=Halobacillus naozhouensis TaxID=554880 RepID=A0ABY8IZS8_9BACI|nr:hypothetical protein [Halobacillus naozhouensis]WFT75752.1 hypothetical protein P9989_05035 [Halobacillus naozhouensis]